MLLFVEFDHFISAATASFQAWVAEVSSSLAPVVSDQQTGLSVFGHDIKEMYRSLAKLQHDRVRDVLHWLASRAQQQHTSSKMN